VARRHGRNGRIYMALASGGTAEPLNFQAKWSINFSTDKAEVDRAGRRQQDLCRRPSGRIG
jgi:hypothetical protein